MVNLYSSQIESLSIHKVGNKHKGEELILSENNLTLSSNITQSLKNFYIDPFNKKGNYYYEFVHQDDLDFNEVYNSISEIFENQSTFHLNSVRIAKHLYEQARHPHIKSGELYIVYFSNCFLHNETIDAIGIFKSEIKNEFMQIEKKEDLSIKIEEGINLNKLDKGCLIFNKNKEEGFIAMSIDSNKYDTRYWNEHFLNIDLRKDENLMTKDYLNMCKNFSQEVIFPNTDKREQSMFMNNSIDYFARNDEFNQNDFVNKVLPDPVYQKEFKDYSDDFTEKKGYKIEDVSQFPITNEIVHQQKKKFKNTIKLDTDIEIKLNDNSNKTLSEFLEKGYDEEKGMYYYLAYFNKEK